jgi:predicted transcriptional regulator
VTPSPLELLNTLSTVGPCPVDELARTAGRDSAHVGVDVVRLAELGLIDCAPNGTVSVPFDAVEILLPLARVA